MILPDTMIPDCFILCMSPRDILVPLNRTGNLNHIFCYTYNIWETASSENDSLCGDLLETLKLKHIWMPVPWNDGVPLPSGMGCTLCSLFGNGAPTRVATLSLSPLGQFSPVQVTRAESSTHAPPSMCSSFYVHAPPPVIWACVAAALSRQQCPRGCCYPGDPGGQCLLLSKREHNTGRLYCT
jgi:hypothetical protein